MNQALFPASSAFSIPAISTGSEVMARRSRSRFVARDIAWTYQWTQHEEVMRLRRLRALLGLFALYAFALMALITVSDGADIGCILGGIAGHVLYATHRVAASWRDAAGLEDAKARVAHKLRSRVAYAR